MSGSLGLSTAPLADNERVDVRRFCGYPAYGAGNDGFQSWRFFTAYGTLEYRLTNLGPSELQVVRQYLGQLYGLEQAVPVASGNLDTAEAASWKHNATEITDRLRLLDGWRRRLVAFLGIPPGPELAAAGRIVI